MITFSAFIQGNNKDIRCNDMENRQLLFYFILQFALFVCLSSGEIGLDQSLVVA